MSGELDWSRLYRSVSEIARSKCRLLGAVVANAPRSVVSSAWPRILDRAVRDFLGGRGCPFLIVGVMHVIEPLEFSSCVFGDGVSYVRFLEYACEMHLDARVDLK